MNQDKYPGIYGAMGDMELRRYERPINDMQTRRQERLPIEKAGLRYQENTECIDRELVIEDPQLAHAYVPMQKLCPTFAPLTALQKGTIFPGLVNVYGWESRGFGGENL